MTNTALEAPSRYRNAWLSVSRLKLYEQCPRAFFYKYVEQARPDPTRLELLDDADDAADFGKVVHAALEITYRWILAEEYSGIFPIDTLLAAYDRVWRDATLAGIEIYQEGRAMLQRYAARLGTVDHWNVIAVEQEFRLPIPHTSFTILGFFDRVDKIDDETVGITDYKTNRRPFDRHDLATDLQASVYAWAARELYPWARRVQVSFELLRLGLTQPAPRSPDEVEAVPGYVGAMGTRTEMDVEWRPRVGPLCSYCDHRARCEGYAQALAQQVPTVVRREDLVHVVEVREGLKKIANLAYARQKELDAILRTEVERSEGHVFRAGGMVYTFQTWNETRYPREATIRAFVDGAGVDPDRARSRLLTVDNAAVKAWLDEIKEESKAKGIFVKIALEAIAEKVPQTPKLIGKAET